MKRGAITCMTGMVSFGAGFLLGGKMLVDMINDYKARMEGNYLHFSLADQWLELLYAGRKIDTYFHEKGYHKIMIYGYGNLGRRLLQAFERTDIEVVCIMDQGAYEKTGMVVGTDAAIPAVDCIVVTPVSHFDSIFQMLRQRTDIPIISIQAVLEETDQ